MRKVLTAGVRLPGNLRQPEADAPGVGVIPRIRRGIIWRQTVCVHHSSGKRRFTSGEATESVVSRTHHPGHITPTRHTSPAGTSPAGTQSLRTHPSQERTKPAFAPHERKNGPHPGTCPACIMEPTLARPCATRLTVWRQLNSWPPQGRSHRHPRRAQRLSSLRATRLPTNWISCTITTRTATVISITSFWKRW